MPVPVYLDAKADCRFLADALCKEWRKLCHGKPAAETGTPSTQSYGGTSTVLNARKLGGRLALVEEIVNELTAQRQTVWHGSADALKLTDLPEHHQRFFKHVTKDDFINVDSVVLWLNDTLSLKKKIHDAYASQRRVVQIMKPIASLSATALSVFLFLVLAGVGPNTVVVSGAAALSALAVALSFLYTDMIQSLILTIFLNPFDVGDRVRLNGELMFVRAISIYFTSFESLHGRLQYVAHVDLKKLMIVNESRSQYANIDLVIALSDRTSPEDYEAFKTILNAYIETRPTEWKSGSLFLLVTRVAPDQFIEMTIWATMVFGWSSWREVHNGKTRWFWFILETCKRLDLTYKLPKQRLEMTTTEATTPSTKSETEKSCGSPTRF